MPNVGELADVLRAVGLYLDLEHAVGVVIENHDTYLRVSWETFTGGADLRYLEDLDLSSLRAEAQALRRGQARSPGGSLAEMLRTLGQELDEAQVNVATIAQERGSFRVSGQANGHYFREVYFEDQLMTLSFQRRSKRAGQSSPRFGWPGTGGS
jgi:hypothetical protein